MNDRVPDICPHKDYTECTPECDEINRKHDEWVRGKLRSNDPEFAPLKRALQDELKRPLHDPWGPYVDGVMIVLVTGILGGIAYCIGRVFNVW